MFIRVRVAALIAVLGAWHVAIAGAQIPQPADSLAAALGRISARLDSLESGSCPSGPPLTVPAPSGDAHTDSLARAVVELNARLEKVRSLRCGTAAPGAPAGGAEDELAALRQAAGEAASAGAPPAAKDTTKKEPVQFIGRQRNASVLNPEISATGDVRLTGQDQGIQRDNAVAREFEVGLQSTLDPYSNTKVFLSFEDGDVSVEEGYIYWTGLPGKVRLDVGKFRQQVGDLNRWHLHALPETEYPLVYQRFFGSEGLDGVGLSLYTALPVSLAHGTHEIWLQGTTTESDPLTAGSHQLAFLGRLQNFWQLTRSTYAQIGLTGVGSENHDSSLTSRVIGLDFRLTYRPPRAGTRQDLTLRAEGYRFHSRLLGVATNRYGGFVDAVYRASQRWILGTRYDRVDGPRNSLDTEWRITPSITWWESEFVYLRLQGEHRDSQVDGRSNRLTLQAVWAMGPHKHETY